MVVAPIALSAEFLRALRDHVDHLADRADWTSIERLEEDLAELQRMLSVFPLIGRELQRRGSQRLLKMRLRHTPFIVWYVYDGSREQSTLVLDRIFHARQLPDRADR